MHRRLAAVALAATCLLAPGERGEASPVIKQGKTVVVGTGAVSETALAAAASQPGEVMTVFTRGRAVYTRRLRDDFFGGRLTLATGHYADTRFHEAAVARLKDGRFAVGVLSRSLGGTQTEISSVFLQPNGFKWNASHDIYDTNGASNLVVTGLTSSLTAAYAWQVVEPSGDTGIRTRCFGRSGFYQGEPYALKPPAGTSFAHPAVAAYGGFYALAYDRQGSGAGIILQAFTGRAQRKGKALRLDQANGTVHEAPKLVSLAEKGLLVVWEENTYDTAATPKVLTDRILRGRTVSLAGELGPIFTLDDPAVPNSIEEDVDVVAVGDKQIVGWTVRLPKDGGVDRDIRGVVIKGTWMSHVRRLTQGTLGNQTLAELVGADTDQFFTFYTERSEAKPFIGRGTLGVFNQLLD